MFIETNEKGRQQLIAVRAFARVCESRLWGDSMVQKLGQTTGQFVCVSCCYRRRHCCCCYCCYRRRRCGLRMLSFYCARRYEQAVADKK